jgi:hypothetical protein
LTRGLVIPRARHRGRPRFLRQTGARPAAGGFPGHTNPGLGAPPCWPGQVRVWGWMRLSRTSRFGTTSEQGADAVSWLDPAGSSRQTAAWPQQRRRTRCPVAIGSVGSGLRVPSHEIDRGAALGRVSHLGQTKATSPIDLDVSLGSCREKRADPVRTGQREPGGDQR